MNPSADNARSSLAAASHAKDAARRLRAGVLATALVASGLLVAAAADYWIVLPPAARWAGLAGLLFVAGVSVDRVRRLWRRPASLREVALDFESDRPDAGCEVSTAAEYLGGGRTPEPGYETEIAAALQWRVAARLAASDFAYARRLLLPALGVAGLVGAALVAFVALFPGASIALRRTAAPWSRASLTRIDVTPGSGDFPVGRDLVITPRFSGRVPKSAEFQFRETPAAPWRSVPLAIGTNGTARHAIPVVRSIGWRVVAGDAATPEYRLEAHVPPAVKDLVVVLAPPAYTRIQPFERKSPDIAVVRGTRAEFRIEANVPLGRAAIRFTNGTEVALAPLAGNRWVAAITVAHDTEYTIVLADARGHPGLDQTHHAIRAIRDEAPTVDIPVPGQDLRAAATDILPLTVEATDDFGISALRIVYHKLGQPERELVLDAGAARDGKSTATAALALAELGLGEYELVAYHAEARDNNTLDGPGIGRSPTYFVEITQKEGTAPSAAKSQADGQKVNLLSIQKQIVADTASLPAGAKADRFGALARRQTDAVEFARMYQGALARNGAPPAAQDDMNTVVDRMEKAAGRLAQADRAGALPAEEDALASLYKVVRAMPQLKELPTQPPKPSDDDKPSEPSVNVVLEEIRKQKAADPNRPVLEDALAKLQAMAKAQAALADAAAAAAAGEGSADALARMKEREGKGDSAPSTAGSSPPSGAQAKAKGAGQGQGRGEGEGKGPGEPNGQARGETSGKDPGKGDGKAPRPGKGAKPVDLAKLAPKQQQLGEAAKQLADRLDRLSGKDQRAGHNAGQGLAGTAAQMQRAAQAMRADKAGEATVAGANSGAGLQSAIAAIERLIEGRATLSDVASEEAPARYEAPIADYFKRLSRAE